MVAHDLRNPLTAIQCQAGLLRDEAVAGAGKDRSVHSILDQVQRMGHTIDELLLFAKPKDGRSSLCSYEISALVASVREAFSLRCQAKGVRLQTRLQYEGTLRIRPPQVYRVLENLVKNALDAVGEGGEVLIASERMKDEEIVIRVADSGSGVPDSIRGSLFEPFVTQDKPGGTGLGLAIVKKIVCEHGGRVWEAPWSLKGACFHLALPLCPLETEEVEAAEPPGEE
jgi:signal transduction histidine kinase